MANEIQALHTRRGVIKGKMTRFMTFVDSINTEDDIDEITIITLQERLNKFYPVLEEFNEVQYEIELAEPNSETSDQEREQFEKSYYSLIGKVKSIINKFNKNSKSIDGSEVSHAVARSEINSVVQNSSHELRLPSIKLPTFDGNYRNWLEFKDAFIALVDGNKGLSNYHKMYYLRCSLEPNVLKSIKSLKFKPENYEAAWQKIMKRYECKDLLIFNHIKDIVDYPAVPSESHSALRDMFEQVTNNLVSLKSLGENVDEWDRLIIFLIFQKFDPVTKKDWENYKYKGDCPTMADMEEFLTSKCEILEKMEQQLDKKKGYSNNFHKKRHNTSNSFTSTATNNACFYCKKEHAIYRCDSFLKLSQAERLAKVKELKLCINCLKGNHPNWKCGARKCSICNKAHNVLLHLYRKPLSDEPATSGVENKNINMTPIISAPREVDCLDVSNSQALSCSNSVSLHSEVLLSTAVVKVKVNGNFFDVRIIMDSGSQSCFASEKIVKLLNLQPTKINHTVKGVGQSLSKISGQVAINIFSRYSDYNVKIKCLVLPRITDKLPLTSFDKRLLRIPENFQLADPHFNKSDDVDILLGSSVFWSSLCFGQEKLGENLPVLQNTQFGWIVAGNLSLFNSSNKASLSCHVVNNKQGLTDESITKFWEIEEVDKVSILSESERYCENHFEETTKRDDTGRFIVQIPFKNSLKNLGKSRDMAINRFYSLEKKLYKNPGLREQYSSFMNEYINLGHMSLMEDSDCQENGYYLPHHAVIKTDSITTRCRVVFDASAKTTSKLSLNDVQFCGPTLQQDIFSILLRFRKHKFVMTADISKMYRQIMIDESHRKYQRIFWRLSPSDPLRCYQLNTVTYGTASAPFLAVRCLIQLANENKDNFPAASKIISEDFYMDDLLCGKDTVTELLEIQENIFNILSTAGFQLRKWLSNNKDVLNKFKVQENLDANILQIGENEQNKTLGIFWDSNNDLIKYSINVNIKQDKITKRGILATICQIFDPLGLLGCVIIVAKLLMQELWKLKIDWDEEVPCNLKYKWSKFLSELPNINEIKIPRLVVLSKYVIIEIHGFCDASQVAYGACLYIRCVISSEIINSDLLCAKSRVAPLKQISLPRLELCGAVLLANLMQKTLKALSIQFSKTYFWTDSSVTLAWIRGDSSRWKTFIANRVSEIQLITNVAEWHHIKSEENPADLLSRGCSPSLLSDCKLWWHGPLWFSVDKSLWELKEPKYKNEIPEQRSVANVGISENDFFTEFINRYSSLTRVQRVLAYILRFVHNIKTNLQSRRTSSLLPCEVEKAMSLLLQHCQRERFPKDYDNLVNGRSLNKRSKLLCLNPFIKDGLLRVGGRIKHSKQLPDKKHPVLLPKSHPLTELILRNEHERLFHCGVQLMLGSVRERYWPISARNSCKKIIKSCVVCIKAKPVCPIYLMGELPAVRVNTFSPFLNVGVDYGGPFLLKDRKTRGAKLIKAYIALFVCMSTKAIHIELVSDLTAEAFLATLRRFTARRGKPANIYSDNSLTFRGADNEMSKMSSFLAANSEFIADKLANDRIQWHFIPARSPSFGGLWESGIKSTKYHLKRVLGTNALTYEEFSTILIQIEGILNSRPLCPLSSDVEDLTALTPAHFLIGKSITAIPEVNLQDVPESRLNKFQRLQAVIQHYWTRWQKEYLAELQTRLKWKQKASSSLKVGTLVLVKNDKSPVLNWQLGRVSRLHPGSDGVLRVVDIKIANSKGEIRRAVSNVCALPVEG